MAARETISNSPTCPRCGSHETAVVFERWGVWTLFCARCEDSWDTRQQPPYPRLGMRDSHVTISGEDLLKDSVANVSQVVALDRTVLTERVAKLSRAKLELLLSGIDVVLGR